MKYSFFILGFATVFIAACEIDTGLEPTRSGFQGTIYFTNEWPEETDEVRVVAATTFPPSAITELTMSEPLPLYQDTVDYKIYTNPQTFKAVGVVWKQKDEPWDVTNIIGIYFPTEDHFTPGQVTVAKNNAMVDSINVQADLSRARLAVESAISGTLNVSGEWPPGAQSVIVAASEKLLPTSLLDIVFAMPIKAGFESAPYSLNVQPGKYALIGALVIESGKSISMQSVAGYYKKKPTDIMPGSVVVADDTSHVEDINITITFGTSFFP